jgi:hypothetical protein
VENKIDAAFMPRQPQRYLARATAHQFNGHCTEARTLILAPAAYLRSVRGVREFHGRLSYETVAAYFEREATASSNAERMRRHQYRSYVLRHAIERSRRGYGSVTHPGVKAFRQAYYEFATKRSPGLRLQPQNLQHYWEGDEWMEFRHAIESIASTNCDIVHKCPQGYVDLQLYGLARFESQLRPKIEALLDDGMNLRPVKARTKSLAVSIFVPAMIPQQPFRKQRWEGSVALSAAERLQRWYNANKNVLARLIADLAS